MTKQTLIIVVSMMMVPILIINPLSAYADPHMRSYFQPGWDSTNYKLNFDSSYVESWNDAGGFNVNFYLIDAAPNTDYNIGVELVWDSTSNCVGTLAQFAPTTTCTLVTRDGVTKAIEAFDIGSITTDANGNRNNNIPFVLVGTNPNIVYHMQFFVRAPNNSFCGSHCPVIFQAPGVLTSPLTVRVPEFSIVTMVLAIALIPLLIFSRRFSLRPR